MCVNMGSFAKRLCRLRCSAGISTWNRFCTTPVSASGSGLTSHSLLSPHSFGVPSYCRLMPSAMLLVPGTCRTSVILYARTPSHQRACVVCSVSLSSTSCSALQSVSSLTGKPQMISENLSRENFSVANSSRYSLYFSSDAEVLLDAYPKGCRCVTVLPLGRVVMIH
jgi:hypothetical protein